MIGMLFSHILQPMLDPVIHKMIKYVQNVEEKDLKDKVMFYKYLRRIYCVSWKCWQYGLGQNLAFTDNRYSLF